MGLILLSLQFCNDRNATEMRMSYTLPTSAKQQNLLGKGTVVLLAWSEQENPSARNTHKRAHPYFPHWIPSSPEHCKGPINAQCFPRDEYHGA